MRSQSASVQTYHERADEIRRVGRYAWALAACGRRTEAEAKITEATLGSAGFKNYDLGGVKYYIGEAWRVLGEKAKARAAFDEAVALCPEGSVATSVGRAMAKLRRS